MKQAMVKSSAFAFVLLASASLWVSGCDSNKSAPPAASAQPTTSTSAALAPAKEAAAAPPTAAIPTREIAGAAQILVTYKDAELAPKTITRSKADAQKRAEEALSTIKKDKMPFDQAAKKFSDDETSKNNGGLLGNFERNAMPEAFSKATFSMKVDDISDVVETPRGFHIIKRTR